MAVAKRHNLSHSPLLCSTPKGKGGRADRQALRLLILLPNAAATHTQVKGTVTIQTQVTGTAAEPENQPVSVLVAPIQKRKYRKKISLPGEG